MHFLPWYIEGIMFSNGTTKQDSGDKYSWGCHQAIFPSFPQFQNNGTPARTNKHNGQINHARVEKVHRERQTNKTEGTRRRKGRGIKELKQRPWPGILMRPRSDSETQVGSPHRRCQITSAPQQEIWDTERARGGKGQDYTFSSVRMCEDNSGRE